MNYMEMLGNGGGILIDMYSIYWYISLNDYLENVIGKLRFDDIVCFFGGC